MENYIEGKINEEQAREINAQLELKMADSSIHDDDKATMMAAQKLLKDLMNQPKIIKEADKDVLYTDMPDLKNANIELKKNNNRKEEEQVSGTRNPMPYNPYVYKLMKKHEQERGPATLAAQYDPDYAIDNNEFRGDLLNSRPYSKNSGYIQKGREVQTELEAKLVKPVFYSARDQINDQVAINVNDPNYVQLADLSFEEQEEMLKPAINGQIPNDIVETDFERMKRRNFIFNHRKVNKSKLIAMGKISKDTGKHMRSHNNVELLRKAHATHKYVKNLFNTSYTSQAPTPPETRINENIQRLP